MTETGYWGIHAKGGKLEWILLHRGQLAIGWAALEDLTPIAHDRELLKARLVAALPDEKPGAIPVYAGQLYRFVNELKVGDTVAYRSTADGLIHLGEVSGPYVHDPTDDAAHPNRRPVKWLKTVPITAVSQGALYELGSAMTFFQLKNYAEEWAQLLIGVAAPADVAESDETVASVSAATQQNTRDFILKRLATEVKGHPFAHFVADLLRTMGYRTRISPQGVDGGIDIVAHVDELGFQPPIVRVQVKSSEGAIGGPTVAELMGNLGQGEFGLFVTLGTFAPQARQKVKANIRLINGEELVDLILEHYEQLDSRYKRVIPLKQMYVPQPLAEE